MQRSATQTSPAGGGGKGGQRRTSLHSPPKKLMCPLVSHQPLRVQQKGRSPVLEKLLVLECSILFYHLKKLFYQLYHTILQYILYPKILLFYFFIKILFFNLSLLFLSHNYFFSTKGWNKIYIFFYHSATVQF